MGNVCRLCQLSKDGMIPLIEKSSNCIELKVEGKEFENCFGLEVLEIPGYVEICSQCQEQLHSFYLFKQKAIKSHYELLHKANEIKKKQNVEIELLNESENVERIETENSKSDCVVFNETIKNEFEKDGEDDECDNSMNFSANTANDDNDNSRKNDDKTESEKKNDSKLKLPESKQKSDKQNSRGKLTRRVCEICGKYFCAEETYKAHMNTHKGLPAYSCEICGKGFNERQLIKYHMKNHNNQRDFVCEICSKAYITNHDLRIHMKCHNDQKLYICDECGKLFRFSSQLNAHKETHSEVKLECPICHGKFNTKNTLKDHIKLVHEKFKNPKLFCILCQKQFYKIYIFTAHMAKAHPESKKT